MFSAIGEPRDVAAIDIGSNSVRLVLYRLEGRAVWTMFNEKVLAGLGRDLAATRRLSVPGVASAMTALESARLDAQRKLDEQGGGEEARGLN